MKFKIVKYNHKGSRYESFRVEYEGYSWFSKKWKCLVLPIYQLRSFGAEIEKEYKKMELLTSEKEAKEAIDLYEWINSPNYSYKGFSFKPIIFKRGFYKEKYYYRNGETFKSEFYCECHVNSIIRNRTKDKILEEKIIEK